MPAASPPPSLVEHVRVLIRANVAEVDAAFGVISAETREAGEEFGFPPNVEAMRCVLAAQETYIDQMRQKEKGQLVEIEKLNTRMERKSRFLAELKLSHQALHVATMEELDRARSLKEDRARVQASIAKLETEVSDLKHREQVLKHETNHVRARLKPATKVFSTLTGKLSALAGEAETARARIDAMETERVELEGRASAASSAIDEARARTVSVLEGLRCAQKEVAAAEAAHEAARREAEAAQREAEAAQREVAEATSLTTTAKRTVAHLQNKCLRLHDQCALLHGKRGNAEETLVTLEQQLLQFNRGTAEVGRRRKAAESQFMGQVAELAKALSKVGVYKQKIESSRSHLVNLYRELAEVESDIAATRRTLHAKGERAIHALVATM